MFKYTFPAAFTKASAGSVFTRAELEASYLTMAWRCAFTEADAEMSPKKPLWFLKGDTMSLALNSIVRVV